MPTARSNLAVVVVDGTLYAVGGQGVSGYLQTVEAYDSNSDTWTTKTPMPTPRAGLSVGVVDGILYAIGGSNASGSPGFPQTVEAYDPKSDTWTTKASIPTPRWIMASGVVDGIIYVVGGAGPGGYLQVVEAYNPKTDTWTTVAPMPTTRAALTAGVANDLLYANGGGTRFGIFVANEAFSPFLPVPIDIKPGDANNTINLKSNGTILVAILSTAEFGATTVDPVTVKLAGAPVATHGRGTPMTSLADLNRDGRLDLLLHFRTQDLQLTPASTEAVLKGKTFSGQLIRGVDLVRIVP